MSVNSEIHNAYNLYIKKNTITIAPRGNFTKETDNFNLQNKGTIALLRKFKSRVLKK